MRRFDWRALAAFLALAALWWLFTLASRCDGSRPRPTGLIPAGQPEGEKGRVLLGPLAARRWRGRARLLAARPCLPAVP